MITSNSKRSLIAAVAATVISAMSQTTGPIITTVGGRDAVFSGEGKRAEEVTLGTIRGVAIDNDGRVVFTDADFGLVLRLGSNNILEVVAGTGVLGFSGDNGPARSAQLGRVAGVAVDAARNIYVADQTRVRKITSDGLISTFAGGGTNANADNIPATEAMLNGTSGVAVDEAGNVYVTEQSPPRVHRISPDGRINRFAGTGQPVAGGPPSDMGDGGPAKASILMSATDVVADSSGGVLIVDTLGDRVRRVGSDGIIRTVIGGGAPGPLAGRLATEIVPGRPSGVALAPDGSLYVMTIFQVLKVGPDQRVSILNGSTDGFANNGGPIARAGFFPGTSLNAMVSDAEGNVYVADSGNFQLRRIGTDGMVHAFAGSGLFRQQGENWPAEVSYFNTPTRLAAGTAGQIYVLDSANCKVREIQADGLVRTVAGNRVCATTGGTNYNPDGREAISMSFGALSAMAVAPDGDLYVLDGIRVLRVLRDGRLASVVNRRSFRVMPPGDSIPAVDAALDAFGGGMAFDRDGNLYIAEVNTHRIRKVSPDGIISTIAGSGPAPGPGSFSGDGGPAPEARLNRPIDVVVDGANNLFILDMGNNRIRKVDAGGTITTHAVLGPINFWSQLALAVSGDLYVSDRFNHRILRVASDGSVTAIAGTGQAGFFGDGGPAKEAQFTMPSGIVFDTAGNLYVADSGNHRVRKVSPR